MTRQSGWILSLFAVAVFPLALGCSAAAETTPSDAGTDSGEPESTTPPKASDAGGSTSPGTPSGPPCEPKCGSAQCGPNGCGGTCGSCDSSKICVGGLCEFE